ncbi:MAG: hypothetical protein RL149_993 [Actinomycetota bacterium]
MKGNKEGSAKGEKDNNKTNENEVAAKSPRPRKPRAVKNPIEEADYFGEQYCKREELDCPDQLLRMLAPAVVEVIAGVRNISQLAAHLSEDVYNRLRDRSIRVAQDRAKRGEAAMAPKLRVANMLNQEPRDGVVESVVLVQSPTRTRAVTIRLEGINHRWRATAVSLI